MPKSRKFAACLLITALAMPVGGCTGNQAELLTVAGAVAAAAWASQANRGANPLPPPNPTSGGVAQPSAAPVAVASAAAGPADPEYGKALAAVNAARAGAKLPALSWSQPLAIVALRRSQSQADDPAAGGPDAFALLKAAGIAYGTAAENTCASYSPSGDEAVQQWLGHEGQRASILDPDNLKVGIGMVKDGTGKCYWTGTFTD